jgi:type IV secretion system protein VirB9
MSRCDRRRLRLRKYLRGAPNRIAAGRIAAGLLSLLGCTAAHSAADTVEAASAGSTSDSRLRSVVYSPDQVYRLRGYAGYQIDLEFEPGESFVGLGAGDVEALAFVAQGNHLFVKPRAVNVRTNLTVLTTRRSYHFDYAAGAAAPDPDHLDVVYVLRFIYPRAPDRAVDAATSPESALAQVPRARRLNTDYWYCGGATLQPLTAWDDGMHTYLQFDTRSELPALFVRNDDGSESLLNFNVEQGEVVVHRIARRFVVRRGRLTGCIVNKGFESTEAAASSGTLVPEVERSTRAPDTAGGVR